MKTIEKVTYIRHAKIKGLEIRIVKESRHSFPNHSHDGFYTMSLVTQGGSFCLGKDKPCSFIQKGRMALINPGQVHSCVPPQDRFVSYMTFSIDEHFMRKMAGDFFEREDTPVEFSTCVMDNPYIARCFETLADCFTEKADRLSLDVGMTTAFGCLLSEYGSFKKEADATGKENRSIKKALQLLLDKLAYNISLAELAQAAGMSQYHFLRLFKKTTGLPPHQYRIQKRIERSKVLIQKGMPLSQVALSSGFSDQSHFSNKFRQLTGSSPLQYSSNL